MRRRNKVVLLRNKRVRVRRNLESPRRLVKATMRRRLQMIPRSLHRKQMQVNLRLPRSLILLQLLILRITKSPRVLPRKRNIHQRSTSLPKKRSTSLPSLPSPRNIISAVEAVVVLILEVVLTLEVSLNPVRVRVVAVEVKVRAVEVIPTDLTLGDVVTSILIPIATRRVVVVVSIVARSMVVAVNMIARRKRRIRRRQRQQL